MKRTILLRVMLCGVALGALGCDRETDLETRRAGLLASDLPAAELPELARGEVLLDAHPKVGAIVGVLEEAPPNSDAFRIVHAVIVSGDQRTELLEGGVQDARFMEDGSIVAISRRNELVRRSGEQLEVLASNAYSPFSLVGSRVAYVTGEGMPEFRAAVIDLATGEQWEASPTLMPAWAPVLSPDAHELMFVSGHTGGPTVIRGSLAGAEFKVEEEFATETPAVGPNAPIWLEDGVIFESEAGTRRLDLATRKETVLRGTLPVKLADGRVMIHDSGTVRAIDGGEQ